MNAKTLTVLIAVFLAPYGAKAERFDAKTTAEPTLAFIEANILGIFYHELGHALIDILQVPIFGQEEDAADVASILMIDRFYEEDSAQNLAYHTAFGFLSEAGETSDVAWWDTHGPDLQRYYNLVCLFYGGNPEEREELAIELDLPQERAEYCEDEFGLAADSWDGVFDQITSETASTSFGPLKVRETTGAAKFAQSVLAPEIAALNESFKLPHPLSIVIESCDEANAYYDLGDKEIIFCTEFVTHLSKLAPEL